MSDESTHESEAVASTNSKSSAAKKSTSTGLLMMLLSPVLALSPFLIGLPMTKLFCEQPANEGNCSWVALGWLGLLSIPAGAIMFFVGLIIAMVSGAKSALAPKDSDS